MLNNRWFSLLVGAALIILAGLTVRQGIVSAEMASAASGEAPAEAEPAVSLSPDSAARSSPLRLAREACLDGAFQGSAPCDAPSPRSAVRPTRSFRSPPDECFDVPLWETCDR